MEGDMGRKGGLTNPAPGVDNTVLVFQIPVGLPSLGRGRRVKKGRGILWGTMGACQLSHHGTHYRLGYTSGL